MRLEKFFGLFFFAVLLAGLASCTKDLTTVGLREVVVNPRLPAHAGSRLPLTAGLYIPEQLINHHYKIEQSGIGGIMKYQGELVTGKNVTMAVYQLATLSFSRVVFITEFAPDRPVDDSDIQLVVVPGIDHFEARMPKTGLSDFVISLRMTLRIYDRRGRLLHAFTETGENREMQMAATFDKGPFRTIQSLTDKSFEEVLTRLARQIEEQKTRLLQSQAGTAEMAEKSFAARKEEFPR